MHPLRGNLVRKKRINTALQNVRLFVPLRLTSAILQKITLGLDKDSLCEKGRIQKEIVLNLKQREKKWAELLVSQNDTTQLSSDAKNYLPRRLTRQGKR